MHSVHVLCMCAKALCQVTWHCRLKIMEKFENWKSGTADFISSLFAFKKNTRIMQFFHLKKKELLKCFPDSYPSGQLPISKEKGSPSSRGQRHVEINPLSFTSLMCPTMGISLEMVKPAGTCVPQTLVLCGEEKPGTALCSWSFISQGPPQATLGAVLTWDSVHYSGRYTQILYHLRRSLQTCAWSLAGSAAPGQALGEDENKEPVWTIEGTRFLQCLFKQL